MLQALANRYSARARARRGRLLRSQIDLKPTDRALDLGGGDGAHFHSIFPQHRNLVVADVGDKHLAGAREKYGYETVKLEPDAPRLPFADQSFDFIFCSSVIEHSTGGPKEKLRWTTDDAFFRASAAEHQKLLADEIRRVGKRYFVQTPYRYFPIESHTWLPGVIVFLPRHLFVPFIRFINRFWPRRTSPDWRLLSQRDFKRLFPNTPILLERSMGFVKSMMAVKLD